MQTFLPLPNLLASVQTLDTKRLGKQRVEVAQLVKAIRGTSGAGWANHPAAKMWRNHIEALKHYGNLCILTWIERGYKNTMPLFLVDHSQLVMPPWFGDPDFHASHRSNLLRKDAVHYGKFGWVEPHDLEYIWPTT